MCKSKLFFFSGIFILLLSLVSNDLLLLLLFNGSYPVYLSFISLMYVFGYGIVVFTSLNLKLKYILYLFIIIKFYIFLLAFFDIDFAENYFHFLSGDANHYHIPSALNINSIHNLVSHLLSPTFNFNGRLTHVFLFLSNEFMPVFVSNLYYNMALNAYLINFIFNLLTLFFVYRMVYEYYNHYIPARKAALFIALNPFFLYYSSMVQKEALIFLALSMLCYFLVTYRYKYLFLSSLIFLFERPYMIVLTFLLIFFLSNIGKFYKILLILFGLIIIELFLGIDRAFSMHSHYLINLKAATQSFLPFDNFAGDILRIFFSPFMLRPFLSTEVSNNIFYGAYYLVLLVYMYIMVISIIRSKYENKLILISLIFVMFVAPFHGVLKLSVLTFLSLLMFVKIKINYFDRST
jgi:hypothetical protein